MIGPKFQKTDQSNLKPISRKFKNDPLLNLFYEVIAFDNKTRFKKKAKTTHMEKGALQAMSFMNTDEKSQTKY